MKTAYFECFSGVAGDMILGALVDVGMPLRYLKSELKKIKIHNYSIELVKRGTQSPLRGTNLRVIVEKEQKDTRFVSIAKTIATSKLKPSVRDMSIAIMECLAKAESHVHGVPLNKVHFHEVGSTDSIIDCVGAAIGLDYFKFKTITASPLPITRGRIKCAHGYLPVPAPATMEIIKGLPLEPAPVNDEIVTPTGAAILKTLASHFGESPLQRIDKVGYGFGDKTFREIPNMLRLLIGEGFLTAMVEATIDDMNPEIYDHVMETLFKAGAVDVTLQNVQMKKNRPGIILKCQTPWESREKIIEIILRETTTTGVRYYQTERRVMSRKIETISSKMGKARVKVAKDERLGITKYIPEYEDMKKIAKKNKVPLLDVYREVQMQIGRRKHIEAR